VRLVFVPSLNLSGFAGRSGEPELDSLIPPLGVLTLAAITDAAGHETAIVDLNFEVSQRGLGLDADFHRKAAELILAERPAVVGFSTMCNSFHIALEIAQEVRLRAPDVPILLGGPQVSYCDAETLERFPFVDVVLRGECEASLPALLAAMEAGGAYDDIPGLSWRGPDGAVVRTCGAAGPANLDEVPLPAWKLFPYDLKGGFAIDVGRGCPFACDFCSTSVFFQRRFRLKSFERILSEARWLRDEFGARAITFVHDLFTANKKWVRAFCEHLIENRIGDELEFVWSASARIDTVDESLLQIMHDAGCRALFFGVETGSQDLQRVIGKRLKIPTVVPVGEACMRVGIEPTLSFIAGFPTEREEDIAATFDLIGELLAAECTNIQLHMMSPQVGTPDIVNHKAALRLDNVYSDIAMGASAFLRPDWFAAHPEMFASFYYFENEGLPRERLIGADYFIRFIGNSMRNTVAHLSKTERLWDVYLEWSAWLCETGAPQPAGIGAQYNSDFEARAKLANPSPDTTPDEWLIEFSRFVEARYGAEAAAPSTDEILAYYLRQYHGKEVYTPRPEAVAELERELETEGSAAWRRSA